MTADLYLIEPDWRTNAACAGMNPNLFHPAPNDNTTTLKAKTICQTCPVQHDCLQHALANPDLHGIWGGTTPEERQELLQRHPSYRLHREAN